MSDALPIDRVEAASAHHGDELRYIDLVALETTAKAATWGPWQVIEERIEGKDGQPMPDHGMFKPLKRRIFTVWHHGQLKGPIGVVNESHVLDARDRNTIHIDPEDAAFIAAADPQTVLGLIAEVRRLRALDPNQPALQEALQTITMTRDALREFAKAPGDPAEPLEMIAQAATSAHRRAQEGAAAAHGAYGERNRLVALLARLFPSSIESDPKESAAWLVVIIDLPTGQASWHIPAFMVDMFFEHVPRGQRKWDGHGFQEKYDRVARLAKMAASPVLIEAARAIVDEYMALNLDGQRRPPSGHARSPWADVEKKWLALAAAIPAKETP